MRTVLLVQAEAFNKLSLNTNLYLFFLSFISNYVIKEI